MGNVDLFTFKIAENYIPLKYNEKKQSIIRWFVTMDFGEWIYTNDTVHIELRAVVPILQLLEVYDKKPISNNISESLCSDVTFLLNTLSTKMKNDFPDKNQITILKAKTNEEFKKQKAEEAKKAEEANPSLESESESYSDSQSEQHLVSDSESEQPLVSDSEYESYSESDSDD